MVKRRFSKHLARALGLVVLACALFVVAPANRATTVPLPVPSPAVSPTPMPAPRAKGPNPVRKVFSSIVDGITGVFRRPPPPICSLPPFVHLASSSSVITVCPPAQRSQNPSCSSSHEVTLTADAPDNSEFLFTWAVTAGRLRGEGRKVTWDLDGLAVGFYTATVEMNDGNQHIVTTSTTVEVVLCSDCVSGSTPCPTVWVTCPAVADSKQPIVFEASVAGGDPDVKVTYSWSVTAGKITSGQGTSKITVDASGIGRQSITATVKVGGFNPLCWATAVCTINDLTSQQH